MGSLQVRRAGVSLMDCPRYCAGVEQVSSVRVRLPFSHLGRGEKEDGELKKGTNHHGHRWHHEWRGLGRELLSTWAAFGTLLLPGIARGGDIRGDPREWRGGKGHVVPYLRRCASWQLQCQAFRESVSVSILSKGKLRGSWVSRLFSR